MFLKETDKYSKFDEDVRKSIIIIKKENEYIFGLLKGYSGIGCGGQGAIQVSAQEVRKSLRASKEILRRVPQTKSRRDQRQRKH